MEKEEPFSQSPALMPKMTLSLWGRPSKDSVKTHIDNAHWRLYLAGVTWENSAQLKSVNWQGPFTQNVCLTFALLTNASYIFL